MVTTRSVAAVAGLAALLGTGAVQARTLEVGPGKEFAQPSAAAKAARDGDHVQIQPGEYFDCAAWTRNKLVIEGVGDAEKVVITDKSCNGKGLFITSGSGITVRNLTLTRARVPDGNGAGIRNEGPDLTVDGVRFVNNQEGILSNFDGPGSLVVRNSLFDRNGFCQEGSGCAHGIYALGGTMLHVENTVFTQTKQGHHIKSRMPRTEVFGCTIKDGEDGTASYLIEQPNGGSLVVRNSTLEKGPDADNHTAAIMIGSEGVTQATPEISIENNNFRNDGGWQTMFVDNLTATDAVLKGNKLSGQVKPLGGDGKVTP